MIVSDDEVKIAIHVLEQYAGGNLESDSELIDLLEVAIERAYVEIPELPIDEVTFERGFV